MSKREPKPITLRTLQALAKRAGHDPMYWAIQIAIDVHLGMDINGDIGYLRDAIHRKAERLAARS